MVGLLMHGMKIISEAKLSIYQKSSMARRATRRVRLLRQLKCLTSGLEKPPASLRIMYMTLLAC